jgi:hypothetical protein
MQWRRRSPGGRRRRYLGLATGTCGAGATWKRLQRVIGPAGASRRVRLVPQATVEKVFALYQKKYFDLNVQHFHEKLQAEHGGIQLSYTWVKQPCRERAWWRADASAGRISSGASGGRYPEWCCTSTATVSSVVSGRTLVTA